MRSIYNLLTAPAYAGRRVECPCCERTFRRFRAYANESGTIVPMCPRCGSLARHRVDWLFIRDSAELRPGMRVLHVAPEPGIAARLRALPAVDYVSADVESSLAIERVDVRDLPFPDASFDAIVCNHVLEHVSDDRRALRELLRVLRSGGWAVLQVPHDPTRDSTFEDEAVIEPRDRERLFGQRDHVRVYGRDYPDRVREAGFDVAVVPYGQRFAGEETKRLGLDPNEVIFYCTKRR